MRTSSDEAGRDAGQHYRLIYGIHPVEEALLNKAERVQKVWIAYGRSGEKSRNIMSLARGLHIPVVYKDRKALDQQAGTSGHQGVMALLADKAPQSLEDILTASTREAHHLLLILDHIQDPRNLGAIIRTANVMAVEGIILSRHRSASITPAVAKVSAGALETTPIATVTNVAQTVRTLKGRGLWVFGADPEGEKTPYETDFCQDICIVVGGEGKGLTPLVKRQCDLLVRIPHYGNITSLNVSVAVGVILYEVVRQRKLGQK
jgi:23S rRNA (guanosine2251-2'-O)-methyltransferase